MTMARELLDTLPGVRFHRITRRVDEHNAPYLTGGLRGKRIYPNAISNAARVQEINDAADDHNRAHNHNLGSEQVSATNNRLPDLIRSTARDHKLKKKTS